MSRRRRPELSEAERDALLHQIKAWRRDCQAVLTRAPIHGEVYKAAYGIMGAIDGLAEALTGDRRHLVDRLHSIGSS